MAYLTEIKTKYKKIADVKTSLLREIRNKTNNG